MQCEDVDYPNTHLVYLPPTMLQTIPVQTGARQQLVLITAEVQQAVAASGVREGLCVLFCPHTTAALTINSYLDAATALDMQDEIDRLVPTRTTSSTSSTRRATPLAISNPA